MLSVGHLCLVYSLTFSKMFKNNSNLSMIQATEEDLLPCFGVSTGYLQINM